VRKKLINIALALILICGCNTNALSVDAYSEANRFRDEVLNKNFNSGVPNNSLSIDEMDRNLLIGKITSIMHYRAGQLVAIRVRDGSISLYDAGGYRATLSETQEGSGKYKITNLQLRYPDIDWDAVDRQGPDVWLGDRLAELGFTEGGLLGRDGAHAIGTKMGREIISFIKRNGLNASFTFSEDIFGMKCNLNLDGKSQLTIDAKGDVTAEWIYDKDTGILKQSIVYNFSVAKDDPRKTETVAIVTYYDDYSRETETHRCNLGADGKPDYRKQVKTTTYQYDENGSKISETNLENNTIIYYSFGRPIEVVHVNPDTGYRTITAKYTYSPGGTLESVVSYNESGNQTSVEVYSDRGRLLGRGTTQDPETLRLQLETVNNMVKSLDANSQPALLKFLSDNHISEIYLTVSDLNNPYVFMTFFLNEDQQKEVLKKMKDMGGVSPQEAINVIIKGMNNPNIFNYISVMRVYDSIVRNKVPFKVKIESSKSIREEEDKKKEREEKYKFNDSTGTQSWNTLLETYGYFDEFTDTNLSFTIEATDSSGIEGTFVNNRTADSEKTGENKHKINEKNLSYDSGVVGQAEAFVDANGNVLTEEQANKMIQDGKQIYIKLKPNSVDMFDGAGFQDVVNPQEGEEIYVAVEDMSMFNAFKGVVGNDAKVAVAGVVTNDINGKMTMQVYNTINGKGVGFGLSSTSDKGYATTREQVENMVNEINKLRDNKDSWVYKNTQTNQGIFKDARVANASGYLDDWRVGWDVLAKKVGGGR
jgi:hypothetical protein